MAAMDLLRHLSFFVAVAEEGHFGNAASRLGMTQPPLSQGMRRLEQRLGTDLVHRGARGVVLTEAGRQLLPRARLLVSDAARFEDEAQRIAGGHDRTVRWGVTPSLGDEVVVRCVRALRGVDGDRPTRIVTTTATTTELVESVRAGSLDVAVVEHPALLTGLDSGPVLKLRRWVVVPEDHPVGTAKKAQVRMLRGLALSTGPRSDNPPAHDLFVDMWKARGVDPEVIVSTGTRELLTHVAAGGCFGVTTTAPTAMPGVRWVDLVREDVALRLRIVWRSGAEFSSAARELDRVLLKAGR
ncbi:LysR family transcriptional regulator [Rhodococcus maanshanensis]|uniref:DNA-binding transcriptional regulator, LysR family n=1 Tax=Rhodococcus maanshanensis TaxID=183556 RepID=A0A1H7TPU1_9NOCA|nr:LysR family transcriptional regulator [Rhodococcus maanshanensis]SEL86474.1 DNA-binding transcriptional regulator, LysR family [Rhodococcus maanshanensis]